MTISSTDSFALESYGYNLTRLAHEWMLPPLKGYEAVVTRIFDILLRKESMGLVVVIVYFPQVWDCF